MDTWLGLDFETYSDVDLPTHGLERYVRGEHFKILLHAIDYGSSQGWCADHVTDDMSSLSALENAVKDNIIVGHNVGFEEAVLKTIGLDKAPKRYVDSAVTTRVYGGSGSLAASSRQFLTSHKMEEGMDLIKLFSIPSKEQIATGNLAFDRSIILGDNATKWRLFQKYCRLDAKLSLQLSAQYPLSHKEMEYWEITNGMNKVGWPVDREAVEEMYARYLENLGAAMENFRNKYGSDFNVNSLKQLKEWCGDRGVKATSFDEKHVEKLHSAVDLKLRDQALPMAKWQGYSEVFELLELKKLLGGTSLKKLKTVLDTISQDADGTWRLRDQYMHCGAGQTLRTTGRSVQMQNLKRLKDEVGDMNTLFDPDSEWTNEELAVNIRQVFTSSHRNGALIVGDFSSIEARGLAWQADEDWKTAAFKKGQDLYKVLAGRIYSKPIEAIVKSERMIGKVGELSCGYGAGGPAVQAFAANMGVTFTEAEAVNLVSSWRHANPKIVAYWQMLDDMLHQCITGGYSEGPIAHGGGRLEFIREEAPKSLTDLVGHTMFSMVVKLRKHDGSVYMQRIFHGVHEAGRNVRYFKPSKAKTGEVWINNYMDPKTKQRRFYELYGGKLSGIITQSLCREMFFDQLRKIDVHFSRINNVQLIGQFHDEVVLDWQPVVPKGASVSRTAGQLHLDQVESDLTVLMSSSYEWPTFPMAAEIKHDYRYTK